MFAFPPVRPDPAVDALRADLRAFLAEERARGGFIPAVDCWVSAPDPAFSARMGARGWIGMTWPRAYGGQDRPALHRHAVTEELLAAGAPVAAHWIADRQTGPQILRHGTEAQRREILPRLAAGAAFCAIGMSESHAGSDLAAVRATATRVPARAAGTGTGTETDAAHGWRLSGRKMWSTGAHLSRWMIVLARTSPPEGRDRRAGLSQFLVDLTLPGVEVSGIEDLAGDAHFNETLFDDVALPQDALLGAEGAGWAQVMGELALERSGPERFLSSFSLLEAALPLLRAQGAGAERLGRLAARLAALRRMSLGIARMLEDGAAPATEAALVKDLGARFEVDLVQDLRAILGAVPARDWPPGLAEMLRAAIVHLPSTGLRGGTAEVLRGIVARSLGMR
jgi:alkylation response protein AidB-like acyl-CoA dehydrogenase